MIGAVRRRLLPLASAAIAALVLPPLAAPAAAQQADSARAGVAAGGAGAARPAPRRPPAGLPDSQPRPPITPKRAFLYSVLVPGLGQARLERGTAGGVFAGIEVIAIFMARRAADNLAIARASGGDSLVVGSVQDPATTEVRLVYAANRLAPRVRARRVHYEDWLALIAFNHLFAGADAYVAANLWDLPAQISARRAPRGVALQATVPW